MIQLPAFLARCERFGVRRSYGYKIPGLKLKGETGWSFRIREKGYVSERTSDGKFVWTFSLVGVRNAGVFGSLQRGSIGEMYICIFVQMGVRWDPVFV